MSPHLNREWLYQKYIVESLSTYEIGRIVSRDPKRVYDKLKDFGIPTRKRGHNLRGSNWSSNSSVQRKYPGLTRSEFMRLHNPFTGKTHTAETKRILSEKASKPKPYLRGSKNGMSGRTGGSNPNWKGGLSPDRQRLYSSAEWKDVQKQAFIRDKKTCQRCGLKPTIRKHNLHVHHIFGWTEFPEMRFVLDNLVVLCRPCHSWVHSNKNQKRLYLGSTLNRRSSAKTRSRSASDTPLLN